MNIFIYVVAEGVLDVVFLTRILCRGFSGTLIERKSELPPNASTWLDRFKWPVGDDIARRAVPAPGFIRIKDSIIGLRNAQGLSNIRKTVDADMEAFLRLKWQPAAFGVVLDADDVPPSDRFNDFAGLLAGNGYPRPDVLDAVVQSDGLAAGVFAFPGKGEPGTLEDVLLPLAEIRFGDLNRHAGAYVDDWLRTDAAAGHADFKELRRPAGAKKAQISAMVSLLKPAKPVAASIEDQGWVPDDPRDCPSLSPLMAFLEQLLAVGEG